MFGVQGPLVFLLAVQAWHSTAWSESATMRRSPCLAQGPRVWACGFGVWVSDGHPEEQPAAQHRTTAETTIKSCRDKPKTLRRKLSADPSRKTTTVATRWGDCDPKPEHVL